MRRPRLPKASQGQRGFVLVVCLIILLVLTVLGVNNMSTSNLEERMASNSQTLLGTFQLAESAVAEAIADNTIFESAISDPSSPVTRSYSIDGQTVTTSTSVLSATGQSTTGSSLDKFNGIPMNIESSATIPGTGATSTVSQGVTKLVPKV
jgi:Tfp pilus assembly protein PilX